MSDALLDGLLEIGTFLVIAGVFLEGAEYVQEVRVEGWQLRSWWKLAQKLGFAILLVGLVVEWYASNIIHGRDVDRITALKREAIAADVRIAEDNRIAKKAADDAAKLGVSVGGLHDFVTQQIDQNNKAVATIKQNAADVQNARNAALIAATKTESDVKKLEGLLAQQRELVKQIERESLHVYRISSGVSYHVPSENCIINVITGRDGGRTKIYLPKKPFQGQIVTVQNMQYGRGGDTRIEIFGNGNKVGLGDSTLIESVNDGGGAGSLRMTFDVDLWSVAGTP